jgi:hypothetical protein
MDCWACSIERATTRAMTTLGVVADVCESCARVHGLRHQPRNHQRQLPPTPAARRIVASRYEFLDPRLWRF